MDPEFPYVLPEALERLVLLYALEGSAEQFFERACGEGELRLAQGLARAYGILDQGVDATGWDQRGRALVAATVNGRCRVARWLARGGRLGPETRAGPRSLGGLAFRMAGARGQLGAACWLADAFALTARSAAPEAGIDLPDRHVLRACLTDGLCVVAAWLGARFDIGRADAIADQEDSDDE